MQNEAMPSRYPESRKSGLIVIPALSKGEASGTMRVRGPADLVAWVQSLTPARGHIQSLT